MGAEVLRCVADNKLPRFGQKAWDEVGVGAVGTVEEWSLPLQSPEHHVQHKADIEERVEAEHVRPLPQAEHMWPQPRVEDARPLLQAEPLRTQARAQCANILLHQPQRTWTE